MRAVLVASGEPHPNDARWLEGADLVVAVDAGAAWLAERHVRPDALVGDLDSVDAELVRRLEADGVAVDRHPTNKDSSDTELAIAYARRAGADEILVIGAIGGPRLDHEVANILLLASASGVAVRMVCDETSASVLRAGTEMVVAGPPGSVVSLFAVGGDAAGIETIGLAYPLHDEPLATGSTRGLSNVVIEAPASVRLRHGSLLVVEQRGADEPAEGEIS